MEGTPTFTYVMNMFKKRKKRRQALYTFFAVDRMEASGLKERRMSNRNWLHRHQEKFTTPFSDAQERKLANARNQQKKRSPFSGPLIPLSFHKNNPPIDYTSTCKARPEA